VSDDIESNDTRDAILAFLARTRVRWESRDEFEIRHADEWPIVSRGNARAEHRNGSWSIWVEGEPVAVGHSNSAAWLAYDSSS
jgi:hypothetical protein